MESYWPQHQLDGGPPQIVVGYGLWFEHATRNFMDQQQAERVNARSEKKVAYEGKHRQFVVPSGIAWPRMRGRGQEHKSGCPVRKCKRKGSRSRTAPGVADNDCPTHLELFKGARNEFGLAGG